VQDRSSIGTGPTRSAYRDRGGSLGDIHIEIWDHHHRHPPAQHLFSIHGAAEKRSPPPPQPGAPPWTLHGDDLTRPTLAPMARIPATSTPTTFVGKVRRHRGEGRWQRRREEGAAGDLAAAQRDPPRSRPREQPAGVQGSLTVFVLILP
jgi:hypothetical protein